MIVDWTPGLAASVVPQPASNYTVLFQWDDARATAFAHINITDASTFQLSLKHKGQAIPGSPVDLKIVPGSLDSGSCELVGIGASHAEPLDSNQVIFVARDSFGNQLGVGALAPESILLSFTPDVDVVSSFEVRVPCLAFPRPNSLWSWASCSLSHGILQ
jgi:hypothetical protein